MSGNWLLPNDFLRMKTGIQTWDTMLNTRHRAVTPTARTPSPQQNNLPDRVFMIDARLVSIYSTNSSIRYSVGPSIRTRAGGRRRMQMGIKTWDTMLNTRDRAVTSSGSVFVIDNRAQCRALYTWIILVVSKQHLVQVGRIDGSTECLS